MLNISQVRKYIVKPSLEAIDLYSPVAENLVVGTGLVESDFYSIRQNNIPETGGLGIFQMEIATAEWMWFEKLPKRHKARQILIMNFLFPWINDPNPFVFKTNDLKNLLTGNLFFGAMMCRMRYYVSSIPFPKDPNDIKTLSLYWKKIYNASTSPNARPASDFVKKYNG